MDETWPLSPLNPNSQSNQTYYVYGQAEPSASYAATCEPGKCDSSAAGVVLLAVVGTVAVIILIKRYLI